MKESIFKTTKNSIEIYRQMVDQYKTHHKETLAKCKRDYRGEMLSEMERTEKENYNQKLSQLRKDVYDGICSDISNLRSQVMEKAVKKDFKSLQEISSLSDLKLSETEFEILCDGFNTNNYWIAKKLAEIAADQGLSLPFSFCPIENQFSALNELEENCRYFIFGTDDKKGEVFNKFGKHQQFAGYGTINGKDNTYEQFFCVSDQEFSRLENLYQNNNQMFSEDSFIEDIFRELLSHEKITDKLHFLNNRMKKMTKKQQEETISKMSENEELQLVSQLCDFGKMQTNSSEREGK